MTTNDSNAGFLDRSQGYSSEPASSAPQTFAVNVFGLIGLTEALWPHLADNARIISLSSSLVRRVLVCWGVGATNARNREMAHNVASGRVC